MAENTHSATRKRVGERQVGAALRRIRFAEIRLVHGDPGDPAPIQRAILELRQAVRFLGGDR